eukprot:jgi/Bigna1/130267/aug1.11_g4975
MIGFSKMGMASSWSEEMYKIVIDIAENHMDVLETQRSGTTIGIMLSFNFLYFIDPLNTDMVLFLLSQYILTAENLTKVIQNNPRVTAVIAQRIVRLAKLEVEQHNLNYEKKRNTENKHRDGAAAAAAVESATTISSPLPAPALSSSSRGRPDAKHSSSSSSSVVASAEVNPTEHKDERASEEEKSRANNVNH